MGAMLKLTLAMGNGDNDGRNDGTGGDGGDDDAGDGADGDECNGDSSTDTGITAAMLAIHTGAGVYKGPKRLYNGDNHHGMIIS